MKHKTTHLNIAILFAAFSLFFNQSLNAQNNCPADAPFGYNVENVGPDCFLTFTWPDNEMPELTCGSPGTPAPGSTFLGTLFDLTLNGSTIVYNKGQNCTGSTFNFAYHPTLVNTYITTQSHCSIAALTTVLFQANRSGGSNFDCDLENLSLLPVELISFNGREKDGTVVLEWATGSEQNNSHFEVEWSIDGRRFEKIGTIAGTGSTAAQTGYKFADQTPNTGDNYYRLKQVDYDGSSEYSHSVAVFLASDQEVTIYPTITKGQLNFRFESAYDTQANIEVFNLQGQRLMSVELAPDTRPWLDLSGLPAGSYVIETRIGQQVWRNKVFKVE